MWPDSLRTHREAECAHVPHLKLLQLWGDQPLRLGQRSVTPLDALMHLRHGVWGAITALCTAAEHTTLQGNEQIIRHVRLQASDWWKQSTTCTPPGLNIPAFYGCGPSPGFGPLIPPHSACVPGEPLPSLFAPWSFHRCSRRVYKITRTGLALPAVSTAKLSPSGFTM